VSPDCSTSINGSGRGNASTTRHDRPHLRAPLAPSPAIPRRRRDATIAAALIGVVTIGLVAVLIPNPGEDLFSQEQEFHTGYTDDVQAVAIAQLDGRPVIVSGGGTWDGTVQVWDLSTGAPIGRPIVSDNYGVDAVAVAQLDGRAVIVSGGEDETVRVWDLATGASFGRPLSGHTRDVYAVAAAQLDGRTVLVSGSEDTTIRTWGS
jgi:WD40 repeat protein